MLLLILKKTGNKIINKFFLITVGMIILISFTSASFGFDNTDIPSLRAIVYDNQTTYQNNSYYNITNNFIGGNATFNQTLTDSLYAPIGTGGNVSWNQTYANTLYSDIKWGYNMTYSGSTYNATYAANTGGNVSWNQTYADGLYSDIIWGYNMTTPANTYTDSVNTTQSSWINSVFLKIADMFTMTNIVNMISGNLSESKTYTNAVIAGNESAWLSTFNTTYAAHTENNNSWNQTYANTLYSDIKWGYNMTYSGSTYNATYATNNGNVSWNQTFANTLYSDIIWGYNMTDEGVPNTPGPYLYNESRGIYFNESRAVISVDSRVYGIVNFSFIDDLISATYATITYVDDIISGSNASWLSTYNATYAASTGDNVTWNQTFADTLYSDIKWGYNMTYSGSTYNATYAGSSGSSPWVSTGAYIYNTTANVGIGTASPDYRLHVTDQIQSTATNAGFRAVGTGLGQIYLRDTGATDDEETMLIRTDGGITAFSSLTNADGFNKQNMLVLDHDTGNVGIGTASPNNLFQVAGLIDFDSTAVADYNRKIGIGNDALLDSSATANIGIGNDAGRILTETNNILIGGRSGKSATSSTQNVGVGFDTFQFLTTGDRNVALGYSALSGITTGIGNFGLGRTSLSNVNTGNNNIAIGTSALIGLHNGTGNTAIGKDAGNGNSVLSDYDYNVFIGYESGDEIVGGARNTLIASFTGGAIVAGDENIFIGYGVGENLGDVSNILAFGDGTADSDILIYGEMSSDFVGINTITPSYPLEVVGDTSDISIYAEKNISATGFITRTSVFDSSRIAEDYIKDSSFYLDEIGEINHSKFYGFVTWNSPDLSRPIESTKEVEVCEDDENDKYVCKIIVDDIITYPYNISHSGVELGMEIDVLRQRVYEQDLEIQDLKTENERIKNCAKEKDFTAFQNCVNPISPIL